MKNEIKKYEEIKVNDVIVVEFEDNTNATIKVETLAVGSITGAGMIRGTGYDSNKKGVHFDRLYIATKEIDGKDKIVKMYRTPTADELVEFEKCGG